ncbi:MAG: cysteine desulfurase CsdA [Rickettsiales bacterium]|nr:cysteine desulfurase CsdA [Rickettsiales bacterium]
MFNLDKIRSDFPIFSKKIYGKDLVYLDTAASAQKPKSVIDSVKDFYEKGYSNIHRGVYLLSQEATEAYEDARKKVSAFINAEKEEEIIFIRGATEGINLVASCFGRSFLKEGDEIIISAIEHHANIVPWQILREEKGISIKVAPVDDRANFLLEDFKKLLSKKTKLVSVTHLSNAVGTILPIKEITKICHNADIPVLVDGCQSVPHEAVDVQSLDCDFYVFSGHKLYGPTGIGVLYGKKKYLENMPPYQTGGEMISSVTLEKTEFDEIPYKFEAGTPNIAGAIGLAKAIDYLEGIGMNSLHSHEQVLFGKAKEALSDLGDLQFVGDAQQAGALISFNLKDVHAHDLASLLDREGIALRAGHHCSQPTMDRFHVNSTARISFGLYNNDHDIQRLIESIAKAKKILS